jgi:hypothetical protein
VDHTVLNDPGTRANIPGDPAKTDEIENSTATPLDALSVLLAAQSSIDAATRQQGHDDQTQAPGLPEKSKGSAASLESPSGDTTPSTQLDSKTVTMTGGRLVTVHRAGNSVIVEQAGSSMTLDPASEVSIGSHLFSAASDGSAVVVDHPVTRVMLPFDNPPPALATSVVSDGDAITAHSHGSVLTLSDRTRTLTIPLGAAVTVNNHGADVATDGHELVDGSSTVGLPADDELVEGASTAIWTSDGSTFTAGMQGSSIVSYLPKLTATLVDGATSTIADETFGVPVSGVFIEHGSSALTMTPVNGGDPSEATTLSRDGQKLTASAAKAGIVVQQGTSTITLAAGQETTLNGQTLGAARSGSALIMDGSTMNLPQTELPAGSIGKVGTSSNSRSADAADATGATDTAKVTTSRSSTTEASGSPYNAALGSMANASLFLRMFCLVSFLFAGFGSV